MAFAIHLNDFDGPLDMLLYLIGRAKVDIKDIFVSEVTQQYIDYVSNAPDLDLDDASGFLAMAATLVEIKSRSLLPREPREGETVEEDPAQVLIRQLEEYQAIKEAAVKMQQFEKAASNVYEKLPEEFPLPPQSYELDNLTLDGLITAFARVLSRIHPSETSEQEERHISRDLYTVPRCMARITQLLHHGSVTFSALFDQNTTRDEVISTFLALLELIKAGRAVAVQDHNYADILIEPAPQEAAIPDLSGDDADA